MDTIYDSVSKRKECYDSASDFLWMIRNPKVVYLHRRAGSSSRWLWGRRRRAFWGRWMEPREHLWCRIWCCTWGLVPSTAEKYGDQELQDSEENQLTYGPLLEETVHNWGRTVSWRTVRGDPQVQGADAHDITPPWDEWQLWLAVHFHSLYGF